MRTVVIITGASGSIFGVELLRRLPGEKLAVLTKWGKMVLKEETGLRPADVAALCDGLHSDEDLASPLSSGSNPFDAVVALPASAGFVAKVACGLTDTLGTRLCHNALKERRRLVIGLRESPLTSIALENAARVSREGAIVMPVSPFFYLKPDSIDRLVGDFVDRVVQAAGGDPPPEGWRRSELARDASPGDAKPDEWKTSDAAGRAASDPWTTE
ncbi:MAG: flavin prenyltransferase UbiX [Gemmatimonadota bacterium]|nr:MAG: flavin prenyltransferase UbiX [Gemmatimonadota bacterium]